MKNDRLYQGISDAAWGYFFLYFDIKLGTLNILPTFVGFLLFLSSIKHLRDEERELALLRPLGILLALWHGVQWVMALAGGDLAQGSPFLDVIVRLVNLYFHFQLLTNLASIAAKYQPEGAGHDAKLIRYRTLQTVMLTGSVILTTLSPWLDQLGTYVSVGMMVVYLIAGICLMVALFRLRRCFCEGGPAQ